MTVALPLADELAAHPPEVLLVDDDEAQVLVADRLLEDRVGADEDVELAGAEGVDGSIANRLNIFVCELLGRDVANALLSARLAPSSTKPLKKMCFANAATSMDHKAISN